LYRRVGFEVEGRLREHAYVEGRYVDQLLMGVLRDELKPLS
jgi:RimJ/RimL family protein N-acetyltransferase